jgi:hypothetical protein
MNERARVVRAAGRVVFYHDESVVAASAMPGPRGHAAVEGLSESRCAVRRRELAGSPLFARGPCGESDATTAPALAS